MSPVVISCKSGVPREILELAQGRFELDQGAIPNDAFHGSAEGEPSVSKGDFEVRLLIVLEEVIDSLSHRVPIPESGKGSFDFIQLRVS